MKMIQVVLTYSINILSFGLRIATVYHMTHTVSQSIWGYLVIAQSYAIILAMLIEYGFIFSASRTLVELTSDTNYSKIAAEILSVKLILSIVATVITITALLFIDLLEPLLFVPALIYAMALGHSQLWYFQTTKKLNLFLLLDFLPKFWGTLTIFFIIISDDQAYIYPIILSISALISVGLGYVLLYKNIYFTPPSFKLAISGFRYGLSGFSFTLITTLSTNASTILLGLNSSSLLAASYFNAEKILSLFRFFTIPINQIIYPKLLILSQSGEPILILKAYRMALLLTGLLTIIAIVLYINTYQVVKIIFGTDNYQTVFIIQGMLMAVPFIGMNAIIGGPYMSAIGQLAYLNKAILIANFVGMIYIIFIPQIAWNYTAYTVLLIESIVTFFLIYGQVSYKYKIK